MCNAYNGVFTHAVISIPDVANTTKLILEPLKKHSILLFLVENDACSYLISQYIIVSVYQLEHYAPVSVQKSCNIRLFFFSHTCLTLGIVLPCRSKTRRISPILVDSFYAFPRWVIESGSSLTSLLYYPS